MIYLTTCLGGAWFLEQPRGSSFEYYPAFRKMMMDLWTVANGTAATCPISIAFSKKSSYCTLSHTFVGYRPQAPRNKHAEVFRVSWWMAHYGGPSPKRHVGFGTAVRFKVSTAAACAGQHTRPESVRPIGDTTLQAKSAGQETKNFALLSSSDVIIYA